MSKLNMILKEVSKLGYKVSKEGKVLGVKGRNLSDKPITKAGYPYFSDRVNKIGKKYKVSDNSVRKWCKKYNLPTNSSYYK
jgi:hypothetical protein